MLVNQHYSFAVTIKVNTKLQIHKHFPSAHAYLNHLWNSCTMLIFGTWRASMHGLAKHFTYIILWLYTCTHACVYIQPQWNPQSPEQMDSIPWSYSRLRQQRKKCVLWVYSVWLCWKESNLARELADLPFSACTQQL